MSSIAMAADSTQSLKEERRLEKKKKRSSESKKKRQRKASVKKGKVCHKHLFITHMYLYVCLF